MSFSPPQILLGVISYLSVLFVIGYLGDRGTLPRRLVRHPLTYVLSLGVIAGVMASNGAFALAATLGWDYLLYYGGILLAFALAGLLLTPMLRICRVHQLTSLADVLAFRFRSRQVGAVITLLMVLTLLPLLAIQVDAVADTIGLLSGRPGPGAAAEESLAALFCLIISGFAILFGTRNARTPNDNPGLVAAIAFESVVKAAAMLVLFFIAIRGGFGSFSALQEWLATEPAVTMVLEEQRTGLGSRVLLLLFFASAVCAPHLFHMAFAENTDSRDMHAASWGVPLYLLVLALPVLPVLWAAQRLGSSLPVEQSGLALGLALQSPAAVAASAIATLSAGSAVIIVTTLALANMCVIYLVPSRQVLDAMRQHALFDRMTSLRRLLIAALIAGGYLFFLGLHDRFSLPVLGVIAFSGVLHFLPAAIATFFWPRATRQGLLAGLGIGLFLWLMWLLLPGISANRLGWTVSPGDGELWSLRCLLALLANGAAFIVVSLATRLSEDERIAAQICCVDAPRRISRRSLRLHRASDFVPALAPALGDEIALEQVSRALSELHFNADEARPYALRHLRRRLEANLSGLLGPAVGIGIIERCLPYHDDVTPTADVTLLEQDLASTHAPLTGVAADVDNLRRHYRRTLDTMPMGVCSIASDGEILLWNDYMRGLTGISPETATGARIDALREPWRKLLPQALDEDPGSSRRVVVRENGEARWLNLHTGARSGGDGDALILVEDISDYQRLQGELQHTERLASIGRLAAGVAHEVGNPVTGIACLAQNLEFATGPEEVRETATDILRQTERISRIVESLVNFSHVGTGDPGEVAQEPCNVAACIDEAVHLLTLDRASRPVEFRNLCDRGASVMADNQKLLQVVINVLKNARDASEDNASIEVRTVANGDQILIQVDDRGHGVPEERLERVFEPFFTTKDVGEGTGLGLPLVYSIMQDMGGSVQLSSPVPGCGVGTRVSLALPITRDRHAGELADDGTGPRARWKSTASGGIL